MFSMKYVNYFIIILKTQLYQELSVASLLGLLVEMPPHMLKELRKIGQEISTKLFLLTL